MKAKLSLHIAKIVEKNGWNQKKAAERMGIDQPKVSKILRGQLREFSVERLIDFLRAIGCDVDIVLRNGTASPAALRVVEEQEEHSGYNPCVPYKEFGPGRRGSRRRGRSSVRARLDGHAGRD